MSAENSIRGRKDLPFHKVGEVRFGLPNDPVAQIVQSCCGANEFCRN
jgi:hypothetical protein